MFFNLGLSEIPRWMKRLARCAWVWFGSIWFGLTLHLPIMWTRPDIHNKQKKTLRNKHNYVHSYTGYINPNYWGSDEVIIQNAGHSWTNQVRFMGWGKLCAVLVSVQGWFHLYKHKHMHTLTHKHWKCTQREKVSQTSRWDSEFSWESSQETWSVGQNELRFALLEKDK